MDEKELERLKAKERMDNELYIKQIFFMVKGVLYLAFFSFLIVLFYSLFRG